MTDYVIVCSKCDAQNVATNETCSRCGDLIAHLKRIEVSECRVCQVCQSINYVLNGEDPKVCWRCNSDEIMRSPKKKIEELDCCESVDESSAENEQNSPECSEQSLEVPLVIQCTRDSHQIEIKDDGGLLGRMGTIEPGYFSEDFYVGRNHAEIYLEEEKWYIRDHSRNGTWINGKRLIKDKEICELKQGDRIALANVHFTVL